MEISVAVKIKFFCPSFTFYFSVPYSIRKGMKLILYMIAAPLFLISMAAYVFVEVRMKRQADRHLDEIYYEFEDQIPALKRYNKWSRLTFASACLAALLLFLAYVL
jgi:hypothetical protein